MNKFYHLITLLFLILTFSTLKSDEYIILECASTVFEDLDFISQDHFLIYNKTLEKYEIYNFIHHPNYVWPSEKILEYLPHMSPIDDRYFDYYKEKFEYFSETI